MLVNYARCLIYSTAPSFPTLAAIRGGYNLLKSGLTQEVSFQSPQSYTHHFPFDPTLISRTNLQRQDRMQHLLRHFYHKIHSNPTWAPAITSGLFTIPTGDNYQNERFLTHVVPIWTRERENHLLAAHLHLADYCAWPIDYPVVPKGQGRVRLVFHAANTEEQVETLVELICEWGREMLEYEAAERAKAEAMAAKELALKKEAVHVQEIKVDDSEDGTASVASETRSVHFDSSNQTLLFDKDERTNVLAEKTPTLVTVTEIMDDDSPSEHSDSDPGLSESAQNSTPEEGLPETSAEPVAVPAVSTKLLELEGGKKTAEEADWFPLFEYGTAPSAMEAWQQALDSVRVGSEGV
jgi:hypothetical protein